MALRVLRIYNDNHKREISLAICQMRRENPSLSEPGISIFGERHHQRNGIVLTEHLIPCRASYPGYSRSVCKRRRPILLETIVIVLFYVVFLSMITQYAA
jgi:hypothetical protein